MELSRPLWVPPFNFFADCIRRMIDVGPEWKMHLSLARKLVDKQSWFMIPLTSGTQSPIFDAIAYIVARGDRASIPRLERLYEKYTQSQTTLHSEQLPIGRVTYCYGPQDYVPRYLQHATAKALLDLYQHADARTFVTQALEGDLWRLDESTVRTLLAYAIRTRMQIAHDTLVQALAHLEKRELQTSSQE